jgi:hypothetical protein
MSSPRFPAIAICPGDSFTVVESLAQLEAASPKALRTGYFDRLYLFDSAGERWRIARSETTSARITGPFGKLVGVQLSFAAPERPSLSEVVEDLCRLIDSDPDDVYNQFQTHDELKQRFRAALTSNDLLTAASSLGAGV